MFSPDQYVRWVLGFCLYSVQSPFDRILQDEFDVLLFQHTELYFLVINVALQLTNDYHLLVVLLVELISTDKEEPTKDDLQIFTKS